jgi:CO/xanthine dehydrogenase Mo-binding subunit
MSTIKTGMNRRSFIKNLAVTSGTLALGFNLKTAPLALANGASAPADWFEFNAVLSIAPNGTIEIKVQNPDFGQGTMTSFPMIVAEELDANWADIVSVQAPNDPAKYPMQITGGSWSVRSNWAGLRMAGATAKQLLKLAAAKQWGVPVDDIQTENSVLSHASGRSASYGDMAAAASEIAIPEQVALKDKNDFSLIGQSKKSVVAEDIVTGKPLFGIDQRVDGMLHAGIVHPPAFGLTLESFNVEAIKAMPGIVDAFSISMYPEDFVRGFSDVCAFPEIIAIVGDSTWRVKKAKQAVQATWKEMPEYQYPLVGFSGNKSTVTVPGGLESSSEHTSRMRSTLQHALTEKRRDGNPEQAFKDAHKVIEQTYSAPFLAHNTMEPMNFFADVKTDSAKLVGPHQGSILIHDSVSRHLGLPKDKVEMQMTRMGGGFGRRLYLHFAVEAALISQHVKQPVLLTYTREDDMTVGVYRPAYQATMRAALNEQGELTAYHIRATGIPESPLFPNRFPAGAVDNYLAEDTVIPSNITVGAYRAPESNFMAVAEQSFLDELAEAAGKDPIDFRLELLERAKSNPVGDNNDYDAERYAGVLKLVREKSDWDNKDGRNLGVAAYFCHSSYCANVIEVEMSQGKPLVNKVTSALDCGIVINPDAAANMTQGGIINGLCHSMYGEMTFDEGAPSKNNFTNYRMLRINEAPAEIDVHFVKSDVDPTGLGEPPMPPTPAALANAIYKATGKRLYDQPFNKALDEQA